MSLEDIEKRLKVVEDVEAIKKLKARYCAYCDDSFNVEGIVSLFAPDGIMDGGENGHAQGTENLKALYATAPGMFSFAIHMVLNPVIEVNGDTASGSWYLLQPCTSPDGKQAMWGSAKYDEEYVKLNGEWKFKRVKVNPIFWTPYDQGWAKAPFGGGMAG